MCPIASFCMGLLNSFPDTNLLAKSVKRSIARCFKFIGLFAQDIILIQVTIKLHNTPNTRSGVWKINWRKINCNYIVRYCIAIILAKPIYQNAINWDDHWLEKINWNSNYMNYILFEIAIKCNEIIEITIFMWIELMDMAIIGISYQHCISFNTDSAKGNATCIKLLIINFNHETKN